jgi:hypothetical protein
MFDLLATAESEPAEIQVLRAALESYSERFGPCHPLVLDVTERLACAWWVQGEPSRALAVLEETIAALPEDDDKSHADLLDLVWKIHFAQRDFESASRILTDVFDRRVRIGGDCHPDALAAQGDLSIILYEKGCFKAAELLAREALLKAQKHLRERDPVTSVIAWNCILIHERLNQPEEALAIAVTHLLWLLAEDSATLDPDLREIQSWLSDRFSWDTAPVC